RREPGSPVAGEGQKTASDHDLGAAAETGAARQPRRDSERDGGHDEDVVLPEQQRERQRGRRQREARSRPGRARPREKRRDGPGDDVLARRGFDHEPPARGDDERERGSHEEPSPPRERSDLKNSQTPKTPETTRQASYPGCAMPAPRSEAITA